MDWTSIAGKALLQAERKKKPAILFSQDNLGNYQYLGISGGCGGIMLSVCVLVAEFLGQDAQKGGEESRL